MVVAQVTAQVTHPTAAAVAAAREAEVTPVVHYGVECYRAAVWYRGHHVLGHGLDRDKAVLDLAIRLSDFAGLTA